MSVESFETQGGGGGNSSTRWVITAVIAVVVAAAAFFAGKAMAGGGPSTLAEAVQQARAGDLPCGDTGSAATPQQAPAGAPQGGAPPGGGGAFALRAICDRNGTQGTANGRQRFGGGAGGFGGQIGEVVSVDGSTLTVRGAQGNTTVKLGSQTTITRSSSAKTSDLKVGERVIVNAPPQGGTARSVLIVPETGQN